MKVYIVWNLSGEYDCTPDEIIQVYQTRVSAKKREAEEAQKYHEKIMRRFNGSVKPDTEHPFWVEEREVEE